MNDIEKLIHSELVELRKDLKTYISKMDDRVSKLEHFKDKLMGVVLFVGVCIGYVVDYFKRGV